MTTPAEQLAIYSTQSQMSSFFIDKMGIISVKSYGAKGDGVADDTVTVQAAITAAVANGNHELYFPHGSYKLGTLTGYSTLTFIGDNVTMTGTVYTVNSFSSHLADYASLVINVKYPPTGYTAAKVDGITDDTNAVNAIINYISTNGGGICYIPKGTCMTSGLTLKSNVSIIGCGKGISVLKLIAASSNFTCGIYTAASTVNIKVADITLDGNKSNNPGTAQIGFNSNITNLFLDNVEIKSFTSNGFTGAAAVNNRITNCDIHDNASTGIFIGSAGTTASNVFIYGNKIEYNGSHGILAGNTSTTIATDVKIESNFVNYNGTSVAGGGGIWVVTGASSVQIINNTCKLNNGDNIGIAGASNVQVSGNEAAKAIGPIIDRNNSGIAISAGSVNIIVTSNNCWENTAAGIIVRGTSINITISNNHCRNNSQNVAGSFHGIQIDTISPDTDSGNYIIVESNRCLDDQTTKTQGYGIKIDANADYVICRNNLVSNNLTGSILNNALSSKLVFIVDNLGYNPVTALTAPALTNGVGTNNTFCFPVRIFLSGGTISAVYIGGVLVGILNGMYILQPNEQIQVNFSGTPTWVWIGM